MAGSWANETDVAQAIGNDPARAAAIIAGELTQAKVDTLEDLRHDTPASPERDAVSGRDIGKNIQLNSAAVLELLARIESLESEVNRLKRN